MSPGRIYQQRTGLCLPDLVDSESQISRIMMAPAWWKELHVYPKTSGTLLICILAVSKLATVTVNKGNLLVSWTTAHIEFFESILLTEQGISKWWSTVNEVASSSLNFAALPSPKSQHWYYGLHMIMLSKMSLIQMLAWQGPEKEWNV